jgi:hypothetical protein
MLGEHMSATATSPLIKKRNLRAHWEIGVFNAPHARCRSHNASLSRPEIFDFDMLPETSNSRSALRDRCYSILSKEPFLA